MGDAIVKSFTDPIGLLFDDVLGIDMPSDVPQPQKKKKESVPLMPQASSEEVRRAKRRALLRQQGRRGRASTIMSDGAQETLG